MLVRAWGYRTRRRELARIAGKGGAEWERAVRRTLAVKR
jgi:hypothetical protein